MKRDANRWRELNLQIKKALKSGELETASVAYFSQAHILFSEGEDFRPTLKEAHRCKLLGMRAVGINRVQVLTADDERVCGHCKSLDGKIFGIRQALNQLPIPGETCTDRMAKNQFGGMCRCIYVAKI